MKADCNDALYVYGFTRAGLARGFAAQRAAARTRGGGPPAEVGSGIDEPHPPFFRRHGRVAGIVSRVWRPQFCGPAGEENLRDLAWLAARACRHQAVLARVMRLGPVLPARFGTLFSSLASLDGFLGEHEAAIASFLERVDHHEEWAVKGFLDPERAQAQWLAGQRLAEPGPPGSSPGAAYLWEQSLRARARQTIDEELARACEGLFHELRPLALEIVSRRILERQGAEPAREMVVNWALLLPAAAAADFRRRLECANGRQNPGGLAFEVSGPWPPYSFCPVLGTEPARESTLAAQGVPL